MNEYHQRDNFRVLIHEILCKPYSWVFIPQEEGGFTVKIVEFCGCFSEGETINETYNNLYDADSNWLEVCLERGDDIPEPDTKY